MKDELFPSELLPNASKVLGIFEQMRIAEEEISAVQEEYPEKKEAVWEAFIECKPRLAFPTDKLYRKHCRELLRRVAKGEALPPRTSAEMLVILEEISLVTPISTTAFALYAKLFLELLGDECGGDMKADLEEAYSAAVRVEGEDAVAEMERSFRLERLPNV